MYIVHYGHTDNQNTHYMVGGVFTKKAVAFKAAHDLAESLVDTRDDFEIVRIDEGYLLTEEGNDHNEDGILVRVESIRLDRQVGHIYHTIETDSGE